MSGKVSATGIGQGYHKAMTLLKNNAAKYGDTLLITKESHGLNSKDLEGEAYVCSNFVETDNKDEKINSLEEVKYIPEGRRVSDLMYVPDQGKFFVDLEIGFSKEMSTWRVDDGRDFLDVETANSEALLKNLLFVSVGGIDYSHDSSIMDRTGFFTTVRTKGYFSSGLTMKDYHFVPRNTVHIYEF